MGVLTDYFRAADAESVVRVLRGLEGHSPMLSRDFDGIGAKGVDPCVVLGALVAAVEGVPWRVDLVGERVVWPVGPAPGPDGPADVDDPWATGPWVEELGDAARDALAGVRDEDLPRVVAEWVRAGDMEGVTAEAVEPLARDLVGLAGRARAAGERLYCWTSL